VLTDIRALADQFLIAFPNINNRPGFLRSTPPLYLSQSRRTNSSLTLDAKPYEVGTLEGPLSLNPL